MKTKRQKRAIKRGIIALAIGLIIGVAYMCKFFPINPIKHIAALTSWATIGWMFSALIILYGLCEIFLEGDL